ncbi:hypothetical protein NBRC116494_08830 [Aurantivibrio plasticivorans]
MFHVPGVSKHFSRRSGRLFGGLVCGMLWVSGASAGWHQAYVAEWFEPAFYYGAETGESDPGTDCPNGTNPELDWRKVLKTSYRSDADIEKILDPENPQRARMGGIRGPNKENVYQKPWVVPDPKMTGVSGNIAYGFDLDNNPDTGFTSPDGTPGIDNQYYRAAGCWMAWRGPTKLSHHAKYVNDGMRDGVFSVLVLVSGEGEDPNNDQDVTVGFYLAKDPMAKDANGQIAHDYTFRINPDPRFQSIHKAKIVDGVLVSTEQTELRVRNVETAPFFPPQLLLHNAKIKVDTTGEQVMAWIGGYRSIDDYYRGWAAAGAIHELVTHVNMVGYWYALRRNADLLPDEDGQHQAISTAYRMYLSPAFIVSPDGEREVKVAKLFPGVEDPKIQEGRRMFPVARNH